MSALLGRRSGDRDEVHDHDVRRPGGHAGEPDAGVDRQHAGADDEARRRAEGVRRAGVELWARRPQSGEDRPLPERRAGADRWAVRRGQGVAGRVLDRGWDRGARDRDRLRGGRLHRVPDGDPPRHERPPAGAVNPERRTEDLLRELAPQVLGALVRRHGQFAACEDAVQEALLAAALRWPAEGVPDRPRSWLLTVAGRSLVDEWRNATARRRREEAVAALSPAVGPSVPLRRPAQDDPPALPLPC